MALRIELQRAFTPAELFEDECGVCGEGFRRASVLASLTDDNRTDLGAACPSCVALLGRSEARVESAELGEPRVRRFPAIETYQEALRRHPEPLLGSDEEWAEAERLGLYDDFYALSWVV
jgi:hypothetical protein